MLELMEGSGDYRRQRLVVGGTERSYLLHLPRGVDRGATLPVVLACHGRNGSAEQMAGYSGLSQLPALVAYLDGVPDAEGATSWAGAPYAASAPGADLAFVCAVLARLRSRFRIDNDRIHVVGKSNGGGFAALLAHELAGEIAAIASVAGAYYPQSGGRGGRAPFVPLLEVHGTADAVMRYDGGHRHGEDYPPVMTWLQGWHGLGTQCATPTRIGTDVLRWTWPSPPARTDVVHYRIIGGGHTWPGALDDSGPGAVTRTISATEVIWRFFRRHSRR